MSIKQNGGVFGRNPTFNDVTIEGQLTFDGDIDIDSDLKVDGDLDVTGNGKFATIDVFSNGIKANSNAAIGFQLGDDSTGSTEIGKIVNSSGRFTIEPASTRKFAVRTNSPKVDSLVIDHNSNVEISTGNVVIATSGKGIDFSATAGTGTSEVLDDYEEGVWTPVIADSSSGGNTGTSLTAQGEYTKVGNVVYAKCTLVNVDTTGLTSATTAFIQGLPFASLNTTAASHDLGSCVLSRTTFTGFVTCGVPDNASSVRFMESATGVSYDYLDVSEFTSTVADIYFSVVYLAA